MLLPPQVECPPEDRDGFEDDDGCAEADNDRDRLPDRDDACPNEPETYNGQQDDDGCPDRGHVVTQGGAEILDLIFFANSSNALPADAEPMLSTIASVVVPNIDIGTLEVRGHAAPGEPERIGLWRAAAVRAALLALGIPGDRLRLADAGTRELLNSKRGPDLERRVSFLVVERVEEDPALVPRRLRPSIPATPIATQAHARVRFALPAPLTLRRGASTTVRLFDADIQATVKLGLQPDVTTYHPIRTLSVVNTTKLSWPPGPITASATDGWLAALAPGASTGIDLGLDRTTTINATTTTDRKPARILAVRGNRVDVEDDVLFTTTVTVSPADRVVEGIGPITERVQYRHTVDLLARAGDISPYVSIATLPPDLARSLAVALTLRRELADAEAALAVLVDQLTRSFEKRPMALARRFDRALAQAVGARSKLRAHVSPLRYP